MHAAGLIAIGAYLPAQTVPEHKRQRLVSYLRTHTPLPGAYIEPIEKDGRHAGRVETNDEGWISQPWYEAWLDRLPAKKRANPFGGAIQRRRVPLDPTSIATCIHPHPMLSSDAETLAGASAIINSGIDKEEIDLVMVSSLVPDRHVPLNASLVQHKLGLHNAGAYNVDTCCSSFITMLEIAESLVRSGVKRNVLLVVSSVDSLINDRSDYHSPYQGDAAAAGIVSRVEQGFGYLGSHAVSQGSRHKAIVFRSRPPVLGRQLTQGPSYEQEFVTFHDPVLIKEIGEHAQQDVVRVARGALERAGLQPADIDFFVSHQPVVWAADAWREAIGIPPSRSMESFSSFANIACASAPTNLLLALEQGRIHAGDRVMLVSPGVGENHIAVIERASPGLVRSAADPTTAC